MHQQFAGRRNHAAILDVFRRTRLFAEVPAEAVERLASASMPKTYADGACIIRHGEPGFGLIMIAGGCIVTSRSKANGKCLIFDLGQPGQVMGTFAAFDGQPSPLDNHARGETHVVIVPYDEFRTAVRQFPDLAVSLIAMHTRRNRMDFERLMMALDTIRVRVAKVLLYMIRGTQMDTTQIVLPVKISQDDIAAMLGISRPSVNKELVRMARENILVWHYNYVQVQEVSKLVTLASDEFSLSEDFERGLFARSPRHFRTTD